MTDDTQLCWNCTHKRRVIGSAHVRCINPPPKAIAIGSGGPERHDIAKKLAQEHQAVVRCVWPGSGLFPGSDLFGYDGATVFGCANFAEKEQKP